MIATISMFDLLSESDELTEAIVTSEPFITYIEAKRALENDAEAQKTIQHFQRVKEQYEEVQRFGKYHPDYKVTSKEIREVKRAVDSLEVVIAFKHAEKQLESLLNEVSEIIARAVSPAIKVPTGNPFFDQMSCSGGCSSGGSCQCG